MITQPNLTLLGGSTASRESQSSMKIIGSAAAGGRNVGKCGVEREGVGTDVTVVLGRLDCSPKRVWFKCSYFAAIAEAAARLR